MPTSTHIAHCVADTATLSAMKELGKLISVAVKRGGMLRKEQVIFAVCAEHILQNMCPPEVSDYVQETPPIYPTPESERSET